MAFDGASCGFCGKTVLKVEEKQAAGKSFHTKCFKCGKYCEDILCNLVLKDM